MLPDPSPKFQFQLVELVLPSVNFISTPSQETDGAFENAATGGMVDFIVATLVVLHPCASVTVTV